MLQPLRQSLLLPCQKSLGPADAASTSGDMFGCPSRAASHGTAFMSKGRVNHSPRLHPKFRFAHSSQPALAPGGLAVPCHAVPATVCLFQVPLLTNTPLHRAAQV